jgi:cbb3-type cytochrome oxidase maturation protein
VSETSLPQASGSGSPAARPEYARLTLTEQMLWVIAIAYLLIGLVTLTVVAFWWGIRSRQHGYPINPQITRFSLAVVGHLVLSCFLFAVYHALRYLRMIAANTSTRPAATGEKEGDS